jgi:hypothetical protein
MDEDFILLTLRQYWKALCDHERERWTYCDMDLRHKHAVEETKALLAKPPEGRSGTGEEYQRWLRAKPFGEENLRRFIAEYNASKPLNSARRPTCEEEVKRLRAKVTERVSPRPSAAVRNEVWSEAWKILNECQRKRAFCQEPELSRVLDDQIQFYRNLCDKLEG